MDPAIKERLIAAVAEAIKGSAITTIVEDAVPEIRVAKSPATELVIMVRISSAIASRRAHVRIPDAEIQRGHAPEGYPVMVKTLKGERGGTIVRKNASPQYYLVVPDDAPATRMYAHWAACRNITMGDQP